MARYIDADKLTDKLEELQFDAPVMTPVMKIFNVIELVEDQPTADVEEVVRCKDCKYLYCFSAIDRQFYCKHFPKGLQGINIVEENPFCSYGERK